MLCVRKRSKHVAKLKNCIIKCRGVPARQLKVGLNPKKMSGAIEVGLYLLSIWGPWLCYAPKFARSGSLSISKPFYTFEVRFLQAKCRTWNCVCFFYSRNEGECAMHAIHETSSWCIWDLTLRCAWKLHMHFFANMCRQRHDGIGCIGTTQLLQQQLLQQELRQELQPWLLQQKNSCTKRYNKGDEKRAQRLAKPWPASRGIYVYIYICIYIYIYIYIYISSTASSTRWCRAAWWPWCYESRLYEILGSFVPAIGSARLKLWKLQWKATPIASGEK